MIDARRARLRKILLVKAILCWFVLYFISANYDSGKDNKGKHARLPREDTCPKRLCFLHQKWAFAGDKSPRRARIYSCAQRITLVRRFFGERNFDLYARGKNRSNLRLQQNKILPFFFAFSPLFLKSCYDISWVLFSIIFLRFSRLQIDAFLIFWIP